jgi:hypothetical protein
VVTVHYPEPDYTWNLATGSGATRLSYVFHHPSLVEQLHRSPPEGLQLGGSSLTSHALYETPKSNLCQLACAQVNKERVRLEYATTCD